MSGSGNQTSILTIDEHFYSVQTELGKGWEKVMYCFFMIKMSRLVCLYPI